MKKRVTRSAKFDNEPIKDFLSKRSRSTKQSGTCSCPGSEAKNPCICSGSSDYSCDCGGQSDVQACLCSGSSANCACSGSADSFPECDCSGYSRTKDFKGDMSELRTIDDQILYNKHTLDALIQLLIENRVLNKKDILDKIIKLRN